MLNRNLASNFQRRQVIDTKNQKQYITEYRSALIICPCCDEKNWGAFPKGVLGNVSYGLEIKKLAIYFNVYQLIPFLRLKEIFNDIFGVSPSLASLVKAIKDNAGGLFVFTQEIKKLLLKEKIVHSDETSTALGAKNFWLHVVSSSWLTYYFPHKNRGQKGMLAAGFLPHYKGLVVHDGWKPYFKFPSFHQLCNAHHLRELTFVSEQMKQGWAKNMIDLLLLMKNKVACAKEKGQNKLSRKARKRFEQRYQALLKKGLKHPDNIPKSTQNIFLKKRGRKKQSKAKNLIDRLQKINQVLGFMYDFDIPFTNNQAERDIRMTKLKQKNSNCFRSEIGMHAFFTNRAYISVLKKNGQNILAGIHLAQKGNPYIPEKNSI